MPPTENLSGSSRHALESLGSLTAHLSKAGSGTHYQRLDDIRLRFKLWAANIGALHPLQDQKSLEYRVRAAPNLKAHFGELLGDVREDLDELSSLLKTHDCGEPPAEQNEFEAAFDDLMASLDVSIQYLFKISTIARRAVTRDRYTLALSKVSASQVTGEDVDFDHIGDLFPRLRTSDHEWLRQKMAKANNFRRRYLQHCKDHQLAVKTGESDAQEDKIVSDARQERTLPDSVDEARTEKSSQAVMSTATTVNAAAFETIAVEKDDIESNISAFSYATDSATPMRYRVIDLGKINNGKDDFICPYCRKEQSISSQDRWKKHVLSDIKAYVCLSRDCGTELFDNSRSWMHHQLAFHLIQSVCPYCDPERTFDEVHDLEMHLRREHLSRASEDVIPHICKISKQQPASIPVSACPFCDWRTKLEYHGQDEEHASLSSVSPERYRRHVGSHLEQAALSVLEVGEADEDSKSDDPGSDDAVEWRSESDDLTNSGHSNQDILNAPFTTRDSTNDDTMNLEDSVIPRAAHDYSGFLLNLSKQISIDGTSAEIFKNTSLDNRTLLLAVISGFSPLATALSVVADELQKREYSTMTAQHFDLLALIRSLLPVLRTVVSHLQVMPVLDVEKARDYIWDNTEWLIRDTLRNRIAFYTEFATMISAQLVTKEADQAKMQNMRRQIDGILEAQQQPLDLSTKKAREPDHTSTLNTFDNLGYLDSDQAKIAEAEAMHRRELKAKEKVLGAEHPHTLTSVSDLALVLQDQGKYKAAEVMGRRAVDGREKVLGAEHQHTLKSVGILAQVLRKQGKYDVAELMSRRALEGHEKVLGTEHPHTLTSNSILALVLQDQGDYEAAEVMSRRAVNGREKVLGAEHSHTLKSVGVLAQVLRNQGNYEAAEMLVMRALNGHEKVLGPNHPHTLTSIGILALVLQDQGKYEAAEKMIRRALDGYEKMLGEKHPSTLTSLWTLASLCRKQKRYDVAIELYERACDRFTSALGSSHSRTTQCMSELSSLRAEVNAQL